MYKIFNIYNSGAGLIEVWFGCSLVVLMNYADLMRIVMILMMMMTLHDKLTSHLEWLSSDWIKCGVIIISVQKYFASEKEILMERKENTALWSIKVNINKQSESNLAKYSNFQIFSHCSKFAVSNFENDLECHFLLQIYICFFAEGRCVLKTNHHVLDAREPD